MNFRVAQFLNIWCFFYSNVETRTQNHGISRWKPNGSIQVHIAKTTMFPSRNERVLILSLIITFIYVCARCFSVVLSGISKPDLK